MVATVGQKFKFGFTQICTLIMKGKLRSPESTFSCDNNRVSAAAVCSHSSRSVRLPDEASIFSAESQGYLSEPFRKGYLSLQIVENYDYRIMINSSYLATHYMIYL
ncbi:Uncharacterised protein r2_g3812 [Pycnogonum litorale]